MVHLTEGDVLAMLPMPEAIRLVEDAFRKLATGEAINQPRRRLTVPSGAVLHQLAGAYPPYFGTKIYSTHVAHGAHFLVLLYDAETGKPLARIEANHLGQIRTGAASGVATKYLAKPEASTVAVIGSGFQARTQLEAVRAVRNITDARVWSRSPEKRQAFAADMNARAVDTAEEAVVGADIIITATFAKTPVLDHSWIAPGAHINAIGSNNAARREVPSQTVASAELIAVDALDQAKIESGDLVIAIAEGALPQGWSDARLCEMKEVVAGARARATANGVTIFKSNGLGVQDIAVAGWVYEASKRQPSL